MAKKAAPAVNLPVPEFTSDRMRLLGPLITSRILEIARIRVATSENLFVGERLNLPDARGDVKLALIVANEMNPFEDWSAEEEALMRGISSKTLRARKSQESIEVKRLVLRPSV